MRKVFTLNADQVDEVTMDNLQQVIVMLENQIQNLYKNLRNDVEQQDLRDHQEDLVAAVRMYRYFSGKKI